jgi:hypothetical protein
VITGWTFDFSNTAQAIGVVIDDNGKHVAWGPTAINRSDVNTAWSITGVHGFSYSIPLAPGTSQLCAYGVNTGTGGGNSALGCRSVSRASGAAVAPATTAPANTAPTSTAPTSSVPANSAPASSVSAPPAGSASASATAAPASSAPAGPAPTNSPTAGPSTTGSSTAK